MALGIRAAVASRTSAAYTSRVEDSEPVVRIMSVPASAAAIASDDGVTPRAFAVPSSPSVIVTPVKPRSWRSRVPTIADDQPAP